MSGKIIEFSLSKGNIEKATKELQSYIDSITDKNALFVQKIAESGIPVIDSKMNSVIGDSDTNHFTHVEVNSYEGYSEAKLIVEGKDLLFIEFGSGIHYNGAAGSSPHPKGSELGYTIGSYGEGHGKEDSWIYESDTGEWIRTYGTQAAMPVYSATLEMRNRVLEIAKEVYGS